jgi:DNA-binding transcriptional regulator GbsR (MarR family)
MPELTPVMQQFILHWGEMGSTWGINRAMGQMYALLYLSPEPLTAEEISETLSLARSTVSTGLRELQGWGIIKVVHVLGDRRDHFEAASSVWEMFRAIIQERKHREMDPTLVLLRESVVELEKSRAEEPHVKERLQEMLEFFELTSALYDQLMQMPMENLITIAKVGDRFSKLLLGQITKE